MKRLLGIPAVMTMSAGRAVHKAFPGTPPELADLLGVELQALS